MTDRVDINDIEHHAKAAILGRWPQEINPRHVLLLLAIVRAAIDLNKLSPWSGPGVPHVELDRALVDAGLADDFEQTYDADTLEKL